VAAEVDQAEFGRHPVGAGPFRFVSWPDEEHLLLEANPSYYGRPAGHRAPPRQDRARREHPGARADAWQGGHLPRAISPPLLEILSRSKNLEILSTPGANAAYLMFQLADAKLRDARVRRAIGEAIDREAIVRYKFDGHATLATTLLPPKTGPATTTCRNCPTIRPRGRSAGCGWPEARCTGIGCRSTTRPRLTVSVEASAGAGGSTGQGGYRRQPVLPGVRHLLSDIRKGNFRSVPRG